MPLLARPLSAGANCHGALGRAATLVAVMLCRAGLALILAACSASAPVPLWQSARPGFALAELYARVETEGLFPDSKTFADAQPRRDPLRILAAYRAAVPPTRAALSRFVQDNFWLPPPLTQPPLPPGRSLLTHIEAQWPRLLRPANLPPDYSSFLALPFPYVVPCADCRELRYFDAYFTMLGLVVDGRRDAARQLVDNVAALINRYGHVPSGSRTYYLSRSQPPVFYLMVALAAGDSAVAGYAEYLPELEREYAYWMHGAKGLRPGYAVEHVVAMPDGSVLNRYWDALDAPREDWYREDVRLAQATGRAPQALYRDLRAGAESGWEFSSRWLADGHSLGSIETTSIVPIDLNSLLYGLERAIGQGCEKLQDARCALAFADRARRRQAAINRYLWNASAGEFEDYHWPLARSTRRPSAAMLYPLFVGLATVAQAHAVKLQSERLFLRPGGLMSTAVTSSLGWDAPQGNAPLQWIAVRGLAECGEPALAEQIARGWLDTLGRAYAHTGRLSDHYDVERTGSAADFAQPDSGVSGGVARALLARYPQFIAPEGVAAARHAAR